MSQVCIWCNKSSPDASFKRQAHIFPQSMGGKRICKDVCDLCNIYFGSKQSGATSVEIALKEPLNISRHILLRQSKQNTAPRFKSEYFDLDFKTNTLRPKFKYRLISDFQFMFTKQFKRGIYKIFLEERSESMGDALNPQFDFIRQYARYGIGDYPVFYCRPTIPAVLISNQDLEDPIIRFTEHSENIMKEYGFYSYWFFSHLMAIPTIMMYELTLENYTKFVLTKEKSTSKLIPIKYISDLDFTFTRTLKG